MEHNWPFQYEGEFFDILDFNDGYEETTRTPIHDGSHAMVNANHYASN